MRTNTRPGSVINCTNIPARMLKYLRNSYFEGSVVLASEKKEEAKRLNTILSKYQYKSILYINLDHVLSFISNHNKYMTTSATAKR